MISQFAYPGNLQIWKQLMKQTSEEQQVLVFTSKDCFLDLKKNPHQFYDLKFIIPFLQGKHHLISFLTNLTTTFKKIFKKKKKIASKIDIVY